MRVRFGIILSATAVTLIGCGEEISGTYADEDGVTYYAFAQDGDVTITVLGAEVNARYEVDNGRVVVSSPQGTVVLPRREGRLYGPMGLELVRQTSKRQGD